MKAYDITIVGFGITGMLVLAILNQNKFDISKIAVIDPYFDGGNLMRDYGDVISNTPLSKTVNALKLINPNYELPEEYKIYDINSITPLHVCAEIIQDFVKSIMNKCDLYQTKLKSVFYETQHTLTLEDNTTLQSKLLILCQGATSKVLKTNIQPNTAIIGDIHACNDMLVKALEVCQANGVKNYIFLGDILDRGPKPLETVKTLINIKEISTFLVVNHDRKHLFYSYGRNVILSPNQ